MDGEALARHAGVDLVAGIPLPVGDAIGVGLENVLDDFLYQHHFLLAPPELLLVLKRVIAQEDHVDLGLEDRVVLGESRVLLNAPDEPPAGIPAVVPRVLAEI